MDVSESDEATIEGEFVQEIAYIVPDVETTCNICNAEFLDCEDLTIHVQQVHEGFVAYPNICQFCDQIYTDLDDYAYHIRDIHFFHLKFCRFCTKSFIDLRLNKRHERKHHNKSGMYACSQCTSLFNTQKELESHEVVKHDNSVDGVILRCMPHLSALLKLNVVKLLQSDAKELRCESCHFESEEAIIYLEHLKNYKCNVYVCNKCGDAFKLKKYLIGHLSECFGLDIESDYDFSKCPTCKKEIHRLKIQRHLKHCKAYKCETCNIVFETIVDLSNHQYEVHPLDLEVLKCEYCSKEYVGQHSLEKHVERAHRPVFHLYKYICKECGNIFKHPQKLFAHYFTKHRELEPYTCRICDKKFRIRKNFTIHIKLTHNSAGVVEFDDQYHVFFAKEKSEKPFIPTCVVPELLPAEHTNKASLNKSGSKTGRKLRSQDSEGENYTMTTNDTTEFEYESAIEKTKKKTSKRLKPKKKRMRKKTTKNVVTLCSTDEEEEPLVMVKKRAERECYQKHISLGLKNDKQNSVNRKQFTCKICNKYCYTYQNYHNHIKTHRKNQTIQCVKCSRSFKTDNELSEHVSTDHATSRLIETLKSVLERKQGENYTTVQHSDHLTLSERFMKTLVKVKIDKSNTPAKIGPSNNSSVKNFIENFIPDVSEPKTTQSKPVVTIKHYASPFYRKRSIKLTKFRPESPIDIVQLKMPERFKEDNTESVKVNVRVVQQSPKLSMFESNDNEPYRSDNDERGDNFQDYDDSEDYKQDVIPEVAQEVLLEGTEEPSHENIQTTHKIVLPKLPKGYPAIHIATLQPQAPFFKIIKVKRTDNETTIINTSTKKKKIERLSKDDFVSMPDGTKFVNANPLAHLLGDKPVEEVLEPIKNKHYTPVLTNYKGLLANAMKNLEQKNKARAEKKQRIRKKNSQEIAAEPTTS